MARPYDPACEFFHWTWKNMSFLFGKPVQIPYIVYITKTGDWLMKFTWRNDKNERNIRRHEIDFQDAIGTFEQDVIIEYDIDHSDDQDR